MRRRIKGIGGEREEKDEAGESKRGRRRGKEREKRKEQFIAPLQNPSIQKRAIIRRLLLFFFSCESTLKMYRPGITLQSDTTTCVFNSTVYHK